MALQSPLGRARGLGSAKEGVGHWWLQRLTAVALVPLSLWFVISMLGLVGADYETFRAFFANPGNLAMMVLVVIVTFWHAVLGVQVVIEDYVHDEAVKLASLIALRLLGVGLGAFAALAVIMFGIGG